MIFPFALRINTSALLVAMTTPIGYKPIGVSIIPPTIEQILKDIASAEVIDIVVPTPKVEEQEKTSDFNEALKLAHSKAKLYLEQRLYVLDSSFSTFIDFFEDIYSGEQHYRTFFNEDAPLYYIASNGKFYSSEYLNGVDSPEDLIISGKINVGQVCRKLDI